MRFAIACIITGVIAGNGRSPAVDHPPIPERDIEFFEKMVRPLLHTRCGSCHSADADIVQGGLRLDSSLALQAGGDSGAVVVPGDPDQSPLIQAIRYDDDASLQMPPEGRLQDREIAILTEWVRRGAYFPADPAASSQDESKQDIASAREFWSFRPAEQHSLPAVAATEWPQQRLDYFVLAAMEREGLQPAPPADRATLLRRLSFTLTGLPPAPDEVARFQQDESATAWERQVDRLLTSPSFGERWARVWLDLARYTDRTAPWLDSVGEAWLYRDWVVRAMNDDLPYDEFIARQLATDLMPETGPEDTAALGFLGLSPNYWKELKLPSEIIKVIVADEWEERVDAVSRTFLGLTVACARCHDHKFDPITMEDYYGLAGVFASCRVADRPLLSADQWAPVEQARSEVAALEKQIAGLKKKQPRPDEEIGSLQQRIATLKQSTPHYDAPMAPAVIEESLYVERRGATAQEGTQLVYRQEPRDLPLFIRGDPNRPGSTVPRGFLQVLAGRDTPGFTVGSGRRELAKAITTDAASLAARVIVNRIWLAHFGSGLVTTPSNFGQSGERPTHPELLDDLAGRLISSGWSLKQLHREILLSAVWQQSSRTGETHKERDPENRFLSRMNSRRLEIESWRDAMLVATGELDRTLGGPSVSLTDPVNRRRTLYGTIHRRDMSTMLLTHDFPDPTSHSPQRVATTTPLQALYALNGPFVLARATALADRLTHEIPITDSKAAADAIRIRRVYQLLFNRDPTPRETKIGLAFLTQATGAERLSAWIQYAQVLLVSNEFLFVD